MTLLAFVLPVLAPVLLGGWGGGGERGKGVRNWVGTWLLARVNLPYLYNMVVTAVSCQMDLRV